MPDTRSPLLDDLFDEEEASSTSTATSESPDNPLLQDLFEADSEIPAAKEAEDFSLGDAEVFFSRLGDNIITRAATRPLGNLVELGRRGLGQDPKPFPSSTPFFEPILSEEDIARDQRGIALAGDIVGEGITGGLGFAGLARPLLANMLGRTGQGLTGTQLADESLAFTSGGITKQAESLSRLAVDDAANAAQVATGDGPVSKFTSDLILSITRSAAKNPAAFATAEVGASTGAGVGAVLGSEVGVSGGGTGEAGALVGGVIGGVGSLPSLITRLGAGGLSKLSKLKTFLVKGSDDALKNPVINEGARAILSKMATKAGVEISDVINDIDNAVQRADELADLAGSEVLSSTARRSPVGSLTGNKFLVALQKESGRHSQAFAAQDEQSIKTMLEGMAELDGLLRSTGDVGDLQLAVELRQAYFDNLVSSRVKVAQDNALSAYNKVLPRSVQEGLSASDIRRQASASVHETMTKGLSELRATERSLYVDIAGDSIVGPQAAGFQQLRANFEALQTAELGDELKEIPKLSTIRKLLDSEEGATVEQLMNFRSSLLDRASRLHSQSEPRKATIIGGFARDIKNIIDSQGIEGLDVARDFSRNLNDVYTRSVVGKFLSKDAEGSFRVEPEALLGKLISATGDNPVIQLDEILEFTDLADISAATQGSRTAVRDSLRQRELVDVAITRDELLETVIGFDGQYGSSVMEESELFVRALADRFRNNDGSVDFTRLSTFVRNNDEMLDRFPQLRDDLITAEGAAGTLSRVQRRAKNLTSSQAQRRLFGNLISQGEVKNPTPILQKVLKGTNRERAITKLNNIARKAKDVEGDAVAGLRTSLLDAAYSNALARSKGTNQVRWDIYRDSLFSPGPAGGKPIIDIMLDKGLIDKAGVDRLTKMMEQAVTTQNALLQPSDIDDLFEAAGTTNPIKDAIVATIGSVGGTAIFGTLKNSLGISGGSGGIVAAGAGAKASRQIFLRGRAEKVHNLILEATSDASLFKRLMTEFDPLDPNAAEQVYRQLDAAMLSIGYESLDAIGEEEAAFPEIPEPVEEPIPVDEPDFFEQLRGGQ